jgi:hypothetical protein
MYFSLSNQPQIAVRMRRLRTNSFGLWDHRDAPQRVKRQGDQWYAGGAEPEELRVGRASFKYVEISRVEEPELVATSGVDTASNHEPPLLANL